VVASSCKLLRSEHHGLQKASHHVVSKGEFDSQVVSAVGEAFNNIAIHGYSDAEPGVVQIEISRVAQGIEVCMMDYGVTFDLLLSLASAERPSIEPDQLAESGMGLFIIRSLMDSVSYEPKSEPDQPNVLTLLKRFADPDEHADSF
jgi:serine/threonine-protein kinase RsbW